MDQSVGIETSEIRTGPSSREVDTLALLRFHDDPMRWEAPRMFNRCGALRRFQRFVNELAERLGEPVKHATGPGLDEASFHGEVYMSGCSLRFSNFGRLVSLSESAQLDAEVLELLHELADDHGYTLLSEDVLAQPYTGSNPGVPPEETWLGRFFE